MSSARMAPDHAGLEVDDRSLLRDAAMSGISACAPAQCLCVDELAEPAISGRTILLGAGKAAGEMAAVLAARLPYPLTGVVVTRHGHSPKGPVPGVRVIEAGHPVPDEQSKAAAHEILELAHSATSADRVLFLISGGGSSLLSFPADNVSWEEKRALNQALVRSGASIAEINSVRICLSKVKGGRLAVAALPAELHTYIISDVVGDDPALVASGPSIARPIDPEAAFAILSKYAIPISSELEKVIRACTLPSATDHPVHVVATADTALQAVAEFLTNAGWSCTNLGSACEGEASSVGREHAALALQALERGEDIALISGGELTVEVKNPHGRGGPNLEYLSGLMSSLDSAQGISAIALDSDGIDGSEDNAGGLINPTSLARARAMGLEVGDHLARNVTYSLFEALGDLVVTGPTRTNVNDIRIILVRGRA